MRTKLGYVSALYMLLSACGGRANLECEQSANCDLALGGLCSDPGTGNRWCAYPDGNCPSGYRYSDVQVGDGVSGQCTELELDAGVDAAPASPLASCVGLANTCGASEDDDCCASPLVPAGTFYRGYDLANDRYSGDMHSPATVSAFRLDKYEVTVGRFRQFVLHGQSTQRTPPASGAGAHPKIAGSGWLSEWNEKLLPDVPSLIQAVKCQAGTLFATWTDEPGPNENRPMNCVTWYDAMAFCAWDGGYLPTDAEWNYAAAGGGEQRVYPWSMPASNTVLDSDHASYFEPGPVLGEGCFGDGKPSCTTADLVKAGTKIPGAAKWGHLEMTGNVEEWALDYYAEYNPICVDCANLAPATNRSIRGGSFNSGGEVLRSGVRLLTVPTHRDYYIGFRCARAAM